MLRPIAGQSIGRIQSHPCYHAHIRLHPKQQHMACNYTSLPEAASTTAAPDAERLRTDVEPDFASTSAIPTSYIRRCRTVKAVIGMLHKHHKSVSPKFWVLSLCHLSELLADSHEQIPWHTWSQLQRSLMYLADPQAVRQQKQRQRHADIQQWVEQQKQAGTWKEPDPQQQQQPVIDQQQQQQLSQQAAPIHDFTVTDCATLLWALARIKPHLSPQQHMQLLGGQQQQQLTEQQQQHDCANLQLNVRLAVAFWYPVLQTIISHSNQQLDARDTCLIAWSLVRLKPPMPAGWFQQFIDTQSAALPTYPVRAQALLLYCCARNRSWLPADSLAAATATIQQQLPHIQHRDLSMVIWSLGVLGARPSASFMTAALAASRRHLSSADWSEVAAVLTGAARLLFCPSGSWLLELYDQLYWTVDQLELRQLSDVVWALGRFRVAVPQELLERLVVFAGLKIRAEIQQQQKQNGTHMSQKAAAVLSESQPPELSIKQYQTAKQVFKLLHGLARLDVQLSPQLQHEVASTWLPAVLHSPQGPMTAVHVAATLHAAAGLGVRLSPAGQAAVLNRLQHLQQQMNHTGLATGLMAAVRLGCRPSQQWMQAWLGSSECMLQLATGSEVVKVLRACAELQHRPPSSWLQEMYARLSELLSHGSTALQDYNQPQQQQRQQLRTDDVMTAGQIAAVVQHLAELHVGNVPDELLHVMSQHVLQAEVVGVAPAAVQRFEQFIGSLQATSS